MLVLDIGDAPPDVGVGIPSTWRGAVTHADADAQTDEVEVAHAKTQHPKTREMEANTDQESEVGTQPLMRSSFQKLQELDAFLEQCTPMLVAQLQRNLTSRAFDSHEVVWEEQHDSVDCLHSLKHTGALAALSPDACTAVAWNAPGTVVAAAYGALDKNEWLSVPSMLCTWSLFRRQLDPSKADTAIELQNCLTCLAFHPVDPSLLAGGAFNGDVLLWRIGMTGRIDPLVGKSVLTNYTHHEPVLQLSWTRDPQRSLTSSADSSFVLVSVGADGKLLMWSPSNSLATPVNGFVLSAAFFSFQDKDGDGQITAEEVLLAQQAAMTANLEGGATISFSVEDPTTFVVGLEAGQIFKGSLLANMVRSVADVRAEVGELPWSSQAAALMCRVPNAVYDRLKLKIERDASISRDKEVHPSHVFAAKPEARELFASPLSFAYTSHAGPVYAARFSPFHRNVFLTASTDGLVRLYNQLQPAPFHTIEPSSAPLLTAAWSPARPLVFAAGSADGALYIYDLKKSKGRPQVTLTVTSGGAVTWVAFNPKSGDLLATADAQGFVKIWRLSTFLTEPAVHELETLDAMATAGMAAQGDDDDADAPAERAGP